MDPQDYEPWDKGGYRPPSPGRREPLMRPSGEMAILALVLGIVSVCMLLCALGCCPCILFPIAVPGLIIGLREMRSYRREMALIAVILNGSALVISILWMLFMFIAALLDSSTNFNINMGP